MFLPSIEFCVATDVPRCRKGDSECMIKSANKVLQAYAEGIISIKINYKCISIS